MPKDKTEDLHPIVVIRDTYIAQLPIIAALLAIGEENIVCKLYQIKNIEKTSEQDCLITCDDYCEELHEETVYS